MRKSLIVAMALALSACGGGGGSTAGSPPSGPASYMVTSTAGAGGTIAPASVVVPGGSTATFTITAANGFAASSVTGCGGTLSGTTYTTAAITGACSVSVAFAASPDVTRTGGDGPLGQDSDLIFVSFESETSPSGAQSLGKSTQAVTAATRRDQIRWLSQHNGTCRDKDENGYCGFASILMAADYLLGGDIEVFGGPMTTPIPAQLGNSNADGAWIVGVTQQVFPGQYACGGDGIAHGPGTSVDNNDIVKFAAALGLSTRRLPEDATRPELIDWVTGAYRDGQAVMAWIPYQGSCGHAHADRSAYFNGGAITRTMSRCSGGGHWVLVSSIDATSVLIYDPDPLTTSSLGGIRRYSTESFWNSTPHFTLGSRQLYKFCVDDKCRPQPAFTLPRSLTLKTNLAYTPYNSEPVAQPQISGRISFSATGLPAGLQMEEDGRITGTTTVTGTFTPVVKMRQGFGAAERSTEQSFAVEVKQATVLERLYFLLAGLLPKGEVGSQYLVNLSSNAETGVPAYSIHSGNLPAGLQLDGKRIFGIPSQAGAFSFDLRVAGSTPSGTQSAKRVSSASSESTKAFKLVIDPSTGPGGSPQPDLQSIAPSSVVGANAQQTVRLEGANLQYVTDIILEDKTRGGIFWKRNLVSNSGGTELSVTANFTSLAATWTAVAVNGAGSRSAPLTFSVVAPALPSTTLTGVLPEQLTASPSEQQITLAGSNFRSGSVVELVEPATGARASATVTQLTSQQIVARLVVTTPGLRSLRVVNSDGSSSAPLNLNVVAAASVGLPDTPTGLSPGAATNPGPTLANASATLSWSASARASYYEYAVRDLGTGDLVLDTTSTSTSVPIFLSPGRAFRWNLRACNSAGCSAYASPLYFKTPGVTITPPATPTGSSPGSATSPGPVAPSNTVGLSWNASPGAANYQVAVRDISSGNLVVDTTVTGTTYAAGLTGGRQYRWNVAACNAAGCSAFSAQLYFQTPGSPSPPATPTGLNPGSTSSPGPTTSSTSVTLDWGASAGATRYDLGVTDIAAGVLVVDNTNVTSTSLTVTLAAGKSYRWNLRACNTEGCSALAALHYFQTPGAAAPQPSVSSVSPGSYPANNSNQTMTINGSNFVSGATLTFNPPTGSNIESTASKLTFNSSSRITYQFNNGSDAGTWTVRVNNPDGQRSGAENVTVTASAPEPSISSISPSSFPASSSNQTMTINGSNFVSGATLTFNPPTGSNIESTAPKLTFNSSSRITYQFNNGSDRGTWTVRVNNPDGQRSETENFTVN